MLFSIITVFSEDGDRDLEISGKLPMNCRNSVVSLLPFSDELFGDTGLGEEFA